MFIESRRTTTAWYDPNKYFTINKRRRLTECFFHSFVQYFFLAFSCLCTFHPPFKLDVLFDFETEKSICFHHFFLSLILTFFLFSVFKFRAWIFFVCRQSMRLFRISHIDSNLDTFLLIYILFVRFRYTFHLTFFIFEFCGQNNRKISLKFLLCP